MKSSALTLFAGSALAALSMSAQAMEGALDSRFGSDGQQTTSFSPWHDSARDIARQPGGKVVLAGGASNESGDEDDFAVLRYNADGQLDTGFGTGGKVTTHFGLTDRYSEVAEAVVIQPDGRVIAAGWTEPSSYTRIFALARYLPNGELDESFGDDGRVTTSINGRDDRIMDIALQADGRIVVTGWTRHASEDQFDVVTARYLANGELDESFAEDGIAITPIGESDEGGNGVAIQRDGRIVVAGSTCNSLDCDVDNGNMDFAFVRYNTDGSLDEDFNDDGKASFATAILTHSDGASAVTLQPDGGIVAAGGRNKGDYDYRQRGDFALVRLGPDGQLDTGFGTNGWVKTPIGLDVSGAADVAYRNDGKLLAVGSAVNNTVNDDVALALYNPDGTLDYGFGPGANGTITTPVGNSADFANAVALRPEGGMTVAGGSDSGAYHTDFAAVSYQGPDVTADAFTIADATGVAPGTVVASEPVTVSGIDQPTLVLARDGEYSINGGAFTTGTGMVHAGDTVSIRHTSSSTLGATARSTLHIGGQEAEFVTTTRLEEDDGDGGGGAVGPWTLALLGLAGLLGRVRRRAPTA